MSRRRASLESKVQRDEELNRKDREIAKAEREWTSGGVGFKMMRAMLDTLAVENYRSLRSIVVPLGRLNVIQGANGSGKSNLYKALRLLADTAAGGVVSSLAREGGLKSTFWAGPERLSKGMRAGRVPVQGTLRREAVRLKLGFSGKDFGYCITMGLPVPSSSAFALDPEIKR